MLCMRIFQNPQGCMGLSWLRQWWDQSQGQTLLEVVSPSLSSDNNIPMAACTFSSPHWHFLDLWPIRYIVLLDQWPRVWLQWRKVVQSLGCDTPVLNTYLLCWLCCVMWLNLGYVFVIKVLCRLLRISTNTHLYTTTDHHEYTSEKPNGKLWSALILVVLLNSN